MAAPRAPAAPTVPGAAAVPTTGAAAAAPAAARSPATGPIAVARWSHDTVPIAADAVTETRDEPNGRRITLSRSRDGRALWVTYARPRGIRPVVAYARWDGPTASDPSAWKLVPVFSLEDGDEGGRVVYLERGRSEARVAGSAIDDAEAILTMPAAGMNSASAFDATFRARELADCPARRRTRCLVLGPTEALYAHRVRRPRANRGWRVVPVTAPRSVPLRERSNVERVATDPFSVAGVHVEMGNPGALAFPGEHDPDERWASWLVRGQDARLLFSARDGVDTTFGVAAYEEGGRRVLFSWAHALYRVRFQAVRLDATTLEPFEAPIAFEATGTDELECANPLSDTDPVLVLVDGAAPLFAHLYTGESYAVLYGRDGVERRVLPVHAPARHYDGHVEPPPSDEPIEDVAPLYRLRGAVDAADAYLEIVPTES